MSPWSWSKTDATTATPFSSPSTSEIVPLVEDAHGEGLLQEAQVLVLRSEEDLDSSRGQTDPRHPRAGHTTDRLPAFGLMRRRLPRRRDRYRPPTCG